MVAAPGDWTAALDVSVSQKVITRADVVAAIKNAATMDFLRGVVDPSMAPSADEIAAAEEEDL